MDRWLDGKKWTELKRWMDRDTDRQTDKQMAEKSLLLSWSANFFCDTHIISIFQSYKQNKMYVVKYHAPGGGHLESQGKGQGHMEVNIDVSCNCLTKEMFILIINTEPSIDKKVTSKVKVYVD